MRLNENLAVVTQRVVLVPYEARHVRQYHEWMSDPDIQEATASEPLTLEEEYSNQQSWRTSPDKLTFILCLPLNRHDEAVQPNSVRAGEVDAPEKMIGDINFFLYPFDDDEDPSICGDTQGSKPRHCVGEVDVMIASKANRGQGVGFGAVCALLLYIHRNRKAILAEYAGAAEPPRLKGLLVKIKESNVQSVALFRRVGFVQRGAVNYFGEVEMVLDDFEQVMDERNLEWVGEASKWYREVEYLRIESSKLPLP